MTESTNRTCLYRRPRADIRRFPNPLPDRLRLWRLLPLLVGMAICGLPLLDPIGPVWANEASWNSSVRLSQLADDGPRLPPPAKLKPGTRLTRGTAIRVGPRYLYRTPSEAATIAKDGDTVEIQAGVYIGDVAIWVQNNLTLRGVGGRAHIQANGRSAEGKAIWVIKGDNTTVEGIEFSGARVRNRNGAGIRLEGTNLTVRNSWFHDNENAILTGANPKSEILIENCRIYSNRVDNANPKKYSHNIYIGRVRKFTLRNSYIYGAEIGHNVKSRALVNYITYNRIMDEDIGSSSYLVDLANGGEAYVLGNLFHQNMRNDNYTLLSYGAEGVESRSGNLHVINNTFVNDDSAGIFVRNFSNVPAQVVNNLFVGPGNEMLGLGEMNSNLSTREPRFVDRRSFDYRLRRDSPAVDAGATLSGSLAARKIYIHPASAAPRRIIGPVDIGAYELTP